MIIPVDFLLASESPYCSGHRVRFSAITQGFTATVVLVCSSANHQWPSATTFSTMLERRCQAAYAASSFRGRFTAGSCCLLSSFETTDWRCGAWSVLHCILELHYSMVWCCIRSLEDEQCDSRASSKQRYEPHPVDVSAENRGTNNVSECAMVCYKQQIQKPTRAGR